MLTQERLKLLLSYNPETGVFRHNRSAGRGKKGHVAGGPGGSSKKYWRISVDGIRYYAHQLAWFYVFGDWLDQHDHKDRNERNNAISNLRPCTQGQNNVNTITSPLSGFRGVQRKTDNSFQARIYVRGKKILLGHFKTAELAHMAYLDAAGKHYGEFADLHRQAIGNSHEAS